MTRLEKLLRDKKKWILHLHASGGMGKTMFLRWLAARHAVAAPQRWPCARVDFDFVNLTAVSNHPWLLLLRLAEQLDKQVPGTPFYELSGLAGEFTVVFRRAHCDAAPCRRMPRRLYRTAACRWRRRSPKSSSERGKGVSLRPANPADPGHTRGDDPRPKGGAAQADRADRACL